MIYIHLPQLKTQTAAPSHGNNMTLFIHALPPGGSIQLGGEEQSKSGGGVHHEPRQTQQPLQACHQRKSPAHQLQDGLG